MDKQAYEASVMMVLEKRAALPGADNVIEEARKKVNNIPMPEHSSEPTISAREYNSITADRDGSALIRQGIMDSAGVVTPDTAHLAEDPRTGTDFIVEGLKRKLDAYRLNKAIPNKPLLYASDYWKGNEPVFDDPDTNRALFNNTAMNAPYAKGPLAKRYKSLVQPK